MANIVDIRLKLTKSGNGVTQTKKDVDKLDKSIDGLNKDVVKTDKNLDELGKNSGGLASLSVGVAGAVAAMGAFSVAVINANKELKQQATLAGLSVEAFQEFAFAAEQAGATSEQASDALNDLGNKIQEALVLNSGAAVDVFKQLGLSVEELAKLSPEEQFEQLAKALENVDSAQRKLFLDELASDALIQLTPLIDKYDEFTGKAADFAAAGGFVRQEDIDKVSELGQSFDALGTQVQTSSTKFLGVLTDDLKPILDELIQLIQDFSDSSEGISKLQISATVLVKTLQAVLNAFALLSLGVESFANLAASAFNYAIENAKNLIRVISGDETIDVSFDVTKFAQSRDEIEKELAELTVNVAAAVNPALSLTLKNLDTLQNKISELSIDNIGDSGAISAELDKIEQDVLKRFGDSGRTSNQLLTIIETLREELSNAGGSSIPPIEIKVKSDIEETAEQTISDFENEIRKQSATISTLKLKLEADQIDEESFKEQATLATNEAINATKEIIAKTSDVTLKIQAEGDLAALKKQLIDIERTTSRVNQEQLAYANSILSLQKDLAAATGDEEEVNKIILTQKINQIEASKTLTEAQKELLVQKTLELDIAEKSKQAEEDALEVKENQLAFENSLLSIEAEIASAQGNEIAANNIILQQKIREIELSEDLNEQQKKALIQKETELSAIESANARINEIVSETDSADALRLNTDVFADNSSYFQNLEAIKQELINLEKQFGLTSEASDAMQLRIDEDNKKIKESYEDLAESFSESVVDTLVSGIKGAEDFGQAFVDMLEQILIESLKADFKNLFSDLLGDGSSESGGLSNLFNGIAGLFSGGSSSSGGSDASGFFNLFSDLFSSFGIYHTGGVVGSSSNEQLALLENGETVRTEEQEKALANNLANNNSNVNSGVNITNVIDGDSIANALESSPSGANFVLNVISQNPDQVNSLTNR